MNERTMTKILLGQADHVEKGIKYYENLNNIGINSRAYEIQEHILRVSMPYYDTHIEGFFKAYGFRLDEIQAETESSLSATFILDKKFMEQLVPVYEDDLNVIGDGSSE